MTTCSLARILSLCAVAELAGCAPAGPGAGAPPVAVPVSVASQNLGRSGGITMMAGSSGQNATIGAARNAVWGALPGAYEALGLSLSFKEDAAFRLGNDQVKVRRALNGVQMRSIVDCGSDLNGEKAETYDIRLTIETSVAAAGDSSVVTTMVSGLGRSPNFGGSDVTCSTKGELEKRILKHVRTQLGLTGK